MADCAESSALGIAGKSEAAAADTRSYVWGTIRRGDCEQRNGRIVFESSGVGTWSCTTLTYQTHSGDIWHARFQVRDAGGLTLFETPEFDSPEMDDGNPPPTYDWSKTFLFDERILDEMAEVWQYSSC